MRKQIYSIIILVFAVTCFFLYLLLWTSSLRLENNKSIFNEQYYKKDAIAAFVDFKQPAYKGSWLFNRFFQNPSEIELYLRAELLDNKFKNTDKLINLYQILLSTKPTWPYYYSGLAQVDFSDDVFGQVNIEKAMKFGLHERKVIKSVAEILFHHWDKVDLIFKNKVLNYLSNQKSWSISEVVQVSSRFSRVYEYCDFLYEKKKVEYAPCKRQYWQPLSK
jgi:hypothetical protein